MTDPHSQFHEPDRVRAAAYLLVALVALLTGLILGVLSGPSDHGSRAGWPAATNPRSLHP